MKRNWVTQVKQLISALDTNSGSLAPADIDKHKIQELNRRYAEKLRHSNLIRMHSSSYSPLYRYFDWESQPIYLQHNLSIGLLRTFSQLRVGGVERVKLTANHCLYKWDATKTCEVCYLHVEETVAHFLFQCPAYGPLRDAHLHPYMEKDATPLQNFLGVLGDSPEYARIRSVHAFVTQALKLRSFLLEE